MNNYEYIIAGLPVLSKESSCIRAEDIKGIMEDIVSQCSKKDRNCIGFLLDGLDPDKLGEEFYRKALSHPNAFVRGYFRFDLGLRNEKTAFLNLKLEREPDQDLVLIEEEEEFEDSGKVREALAIEDLVQREKALDAILWEKAEELTLLHVFDLDLILCFLVRLKIVERYLRLDPVAGKELFRKFVEEIRNRKQ